MKAIFFMIMCPEMHPLRDTSRRGCPVGPDSPFYFQRLRPILANGSFPL